MNDWENYKHARNNYNKLIKTTIKSHFSNDIQNNKGNLKKTWKRKNQFANKWFHNIDIGQLNGVVFLDLKKAFDTVDHKILQHKLHLYGIKGIDLNWFRSYLSDRKQYCRVNDHLSHPLEMVCGIPQGSILEPLLFLIYVNDLPNCLKHTRCNMFADDTQIDTSSNNIDSIANILNEDLINVSDWMKANKLSLNASKTEYMVITKGFTKLKVIHQSLWATIK